MFRNYYEDVEKYKQYYILITLQENIISKAIDFATKKTEKKLNEFHHKIDGESEYKRALTGIKGELAVEQLLEKEFIDWSIGESQNYDKADLFPLGLNIGIKSVERGKFPIIHKKIKRPEIITIIYDWNNVLICGFASIPVLRKYQDDNLIIDPNLRKKGTKTGFYGFDFLQDFKSIKDLINCTWYRK